MLLINLEIVVIISYDMNDQIWGSPAVADIDNDGDVETIATSKIKIIILIQMGQCNINTMVNLIRTPLGDIDVTLS